jgi:hypothetical protein
MGSTRSAPLRPSFASSRASRTYGEYTNQEQGFVRDFAMVRGREKEDEMTNESTYRVFQDEGQHQKDHSAFRRWQRDNPRGYVLNFRVGKPPMLHRFLCPHIESFSNPRASLTARPSSARRTVRR